MTGEIEQALEREIAELKVELAAAQALLKEINKQEPAMNITNGVVTWSQVPAGYNGQLFFESLAQTSPTEALDKLLEAERVKVWNEFADMEPVGYFDPQYKDYSCVNRIGWNALIQRPERKELK